MKLGFDGGIKIEFHGAKLTSDGGLLAYRDLDDALELFDSVSTNFHDNRTGRNIQHAMPTLLRQSIYSRLEDYEDVNDAERLSIDLSCERSISYIPTYSTLWRMSDRRYELINRSTKNIIWYESGHSLPPGWADEALKWFKEHM